MRTYESICLGVPKVLLPRAETDLSKWAVIACDQFTSEPEYWRKAGDFVGGYPSALNIIFPEVCLGEKDQDLRIARICGFMKRYVEEGLFIETEGFIYVERSLGRHTRKGLMVCLDLDCYDFHKGATSLIRATEGTILERIPPRVRIREKATIEIPHIMVLIDDPEDLVIGPLARGKERLEKLYDFDLMMGSGRLAGYRVADPGIEKGIARGIEALAEPARFEKKYGLSRGLPVLLYAMGDGNHSLATAKTIWEKAKEGEVDKGRLAGSPLRHAMVELVNLHDEALVFEPIHRVLFDIAAGRNLVDEMSAFYPGRVRFSSAETLEKMKASVDSQKEGSHKMGVITAQGFGVVEVANPPANLPVGTLQAFLDAFMKGKAAREIDYVHGAESVAQLGGKPGNSGLYLPAMKKEDLFKTVILDGALPRKTFSMGEAWEKRFYMEARRIG